MSILTFSLITYSRVSEAWDGITYAFDFKSIPKEKIGEPDEKLAIKVHHIVIRCSGTLIAIWNLADGDFIKVLYWYAHKAITENPSEKEQIIELHSGNTPGECPYDPKVINFPNPNPFDVEFSRRIGF